MPLSKTITAPNGTQLSFHKIIKIEISGDLLTATLSVGSWATEADYMANKNLAWMSYEVVPFGTELLSELSAPLLTEGQFSGATEVPDSLETLDAVRVRKWADIKLTRSRIEYGGFEWDGSRFDSDETSRARIQGAVQLAVIAQSAGAPYAQDWTLEDNSVRTLSAEDVIAVGVALGQHVSAVFETARQLRELIDSATNAEEVYAVEWPISQS